MSPRHLSIASAALILATGPLSGGQSFLVTGEPFLVANGEAFTIQSSVGDLERNRAAVVERGVASNLFLVPSGAPAAGSIAHACLNVDGVDTSLCVDYPAALWPTPSAGNTSTTVSLAQGSVVSIHVTETGGVTSGQNYRASFQIEQLPTDVFGDGFESGDTSLWSSTVGGFAAGLSLDGSVARQSSAPWLEEEATTGGPTASLAAMIVTGEPFLVANGDVFTIGDAGGGFERNRAVAPRAGTLRNLFLAPNQVPTAGALVRACLNLNGSDTGLCVDYSSADGSSPKGNSESGVAVDQGDVVSVHLMELNGVSSGTNFRTSFEFAPASTETAGAILITGEPFVFADADLFSVGGSSGEEARNRAAAVATGTLRNLFVIPNQAVGGGSQFTACVRVNGVDTGLCVAYTDADAGAKGNTTDTVAVNQGDLVTVHFAAAGVSPSANVRASFEFQE